MTQDTEQSTTRSGQDTWLRSPLQIVAWLVLGTVGFGALLDAVSNSIALFNVSRAVTVTLVATIVWTVLELVVRLLKPRLTTSPPVRLRKLGAKPLWATVGAIGLVWIGALGNRVRPQTPSSASPGTVAHDCERPVQPSGDIESLEDAAHGVTTRIVRFKSSCKFAALADVNRVLVDARSRSIKDYLEAVEKSRAFRLSEGSTGEYTYGPDGLHLDFTCRPRLVRATVISVVCLQAYFVGEPQNHSAYDTSTLNFELDLARAHLFTLDDVLVDGSFAASELERLIRLELKAQDVHDYWISDRKLFSESIAEGFGLNAEGAVFRLGYYATGPFVDGAREVVVPYQKLRGVFRADSPALFGVN